MPAAAPATNALIDLIDPLSVAALKGSLEDLKRGQVLLQSGAPEVNVYFPITAVLSLVSTMASGDSCEVGLVGREGMVGLAGVLAATDSPSSCVVQVGGMCLRLPADAVRAVRNSDPLMRGALDRYTTARLIQVAQVAACSRLHPIGGRLARWLLMLRDRVDRDHLTLSQQSIADSLGARRPTITLELQRLHATGAIDYRTRIVKIADRARLESKKRLYYYTPQWKLVWWRFRQHKLVPIAGVLISASQRQHISFDSFFTNTMFHEVAHGLGIKNTINDKGTVREALKDLASSMEEGKADVLGLYMITSLHEAGELGEVDLRDNYVTFMAGMLRSMRFGASSAHGKANMVRFNFFAERGAFVRDPETETYSVDFERMEEAMNALSGLLLTLQGTGDYEGTAKLMNEKGLIDAALQSDLDKLMRADIPVDIEFSQGLNELGLAE